jgi:hypothetical protein
MFNIFYLCEPVHVLQFWCRQIIVEDGENFQACETIMFFKVLLKLFI